MTGSADVYGFRICIQDCVLLGLLTTAICPLDDLRLVQVGHG